MIHLIKSYFLVEHGEKIIHLSWESCLENGMFYVEMAPTLDSPFFHLTTTSKTSIKVKVDYFFARTFKFAISSAQDKSSRVLVDVPVPTIDLPNPRITEVKRSEDQFLMSWVFPFDIPDLHGFSLCTEHGTIIPHIMRNIRCLSIPVHKVPYGQVYLQAYTHGKYSKSRSKLIRLALLELD